MTRRRRWFAIPIALALVATACDTATVSPLPSVAVTPPPAAIDWHDATQPVEARVEALLAEMTIDEKIGQMTQLENGLGRPGGRHGPPARIGAERRRRGPDAERPRRAGTRWSRRTRRPRSSTRLGIPMLYGVDAVHGHNNVVGATIFPHQIGLGAAARPGPRRADRAGDGASRWRRPGIRWDFGPVVAVPQDVRWGRTYEGYGEDPLLVSDLGERVHPRAPGRRPDRRRTRRARPPSTSSATAARPWGSSTTPGYLIDQGVSPTSTRRRFRAIHLTPYEAAVEAGVADRHGLVLEHRRRQGPRRPPPADRGPQGRARVHRVRRLGLGRRRPGRPRLRRGGRQGDHRGHRHGHGPVRRRRASRTRSGPGSRAGTSLGTRVDDAVAPDPARQVRDGALRDADAAGGTTRGRRLGRRPRRSPARRSAKSAVLLKTTARRAAARRRATTRPARRLAAPTTSGSSPAAGRSRGRGQPGPNHARARPSPTPSRLGSATGSRSTPAGDFPAGTRATTGIVVVAEPPYAEGEGDSATLALPADRPRRSSRGCARSSTG